MTVGVPNPPGGGTPANCPAARPQQGRWVIAGNRLPLAGRVRDVPGRLGLLLDDGSVADRTVRAADVLIALPVGISWREMGDDIREALCEALLDPTGWRVDEPLHDALAAAATELIDGSIGALAESHGGSIELVSVIGDHVTVRMSGACHGCPAADSTLHDRLQRELADG